ncbi:hypothetical protein CLOP_g12370 [Closterium sp. NIES-67]|nr:hypothetical protein CLOP_g12370 [Closterium sp. NIES-67]
MVRPVGGGTHPAQQAVSEARRGTVSMTCHMGPLVAVWRVGLTGKCRLQDRVATVDDLIFFLAQHAKAASPKTMPRPQQSCWRDTRKHTGSYSRAVCEMDPPLPHNS